MVISLPTIVIYKTHYTYKVRPVTLLSVLVLRGKGGVLKRVLQGEVLS